LYLAKVAYAHPTGRGYLSKARFDHPRGLMSIEKTLFAAADKMRGAMDAGEGIVRANGLEAQG